MVYSPESLLRCYQALDANVATEKHLLAIIGRDGSKDFREIPGKYLLSPNPTCSHSNWQCATTLAIFPDVKDEEEPAVVTRMLSFFDANLTSWIRSDPGWKTENGSTYGTRWFKAFSIKPEGWEGEIKLTISIFSKVSVED